MANRDVTVRLRAEVGNFEAAMKRAAAVSKEVAATGQGAFDKLAQAQREHEQAWSTLSTTAMVAGGSMVAAVGSVVAKYASFDKAMSAVQASTHASGVEMEKLRELAMKAGADTAYSGEEAAAGINELAKAGVSTNDILRGGLTGALSLAAAGEIEVGDAAELAATAMTQFNLEGKDLSHVADLLAAGAGKAQGSVGDLGYALKQSGLVASQAGISIEETVGTLSAFASAGLTGSDAGTSFKTMLQKLQNPSDQAAQTLSELGVSMYDSQGNFVGMVELADQLRAGMEDLTPAQRDAAMATIFGSDAVRAANVLYAQGGAGIQDWINKVNDAGYAAETAAALQDNLAGDLEKLGGAFDTLALQSGGSLNDMFRSFVQGATDVLELIGQIPGPVLTAGAAITGLGGAGLLAVGGIMKGVSAVAEFKDAADALGLKLPELDSKMGRTAHNATMLAAYFVAAGAALNLLFEGTESATIGAERMGNALAGSKGNIEALNESFRNAEWANGNGSWWQGSIDGINGVGDAITNVQSLSWAEELGSWGAGMVGISDNTAKLKEDIANLDSALAGMVQGGSMADAQESFKQIADETQAAGGDIQKLREQFPQLEGAILDYASSLGVTMTEQETLQAMMGEMPPKLLEAQAAAEGAGTGMGELGGAMGELAGTAEETAASFEELVQALESMGVLYVSQEQAMGDYYEAISEMQSQLGAVAEAQVYLGEVFDASTGKFNQTTDLGRQTSDAFFQLKDAGLQAAGAMAENGASHEALTGQLVDTYNQLYNNAVQLGLTSEEADTLTRSVLAIPDDVDIETWMSDEAKKVANAAEDAVNAVPDSHRTDSSMSSAARDMANQTKGAIDAIPAFKNIVIRTTRTEVIQKSALGRHEIGNFGGPRLYTGGFPTSGAFPIRGFANGGLLPGVPPANPYMDNLVGMVIDTGEPVMLRSREFIVNEPGTHRGENLSWLRWMNAGGTMPTPAPRGFAVGGSPAALPAPAGAGVAVEASPIHAAIESGVDSALSRWQIRIEENDRGFKARMNRVQKMR